MKKSAFLLAGGLLLVSSARLGAEAPVIYGFMDYSDSWLDDGSESYSHYGFYSYRADGSDGKEFTPVSPIGPDNNWATEGAAYVDGKYYCYSLVGNWMSYGLTFRAMDAESWACDFSKTYTYVNSNKTNEESQKAYLVPSDMTYDPVNDVIYAAARRYQSQEDSWLCSVDRATGLMTRIVEIPAMASLTSDSNGKLLGIGIDGNLYKVDAGGATVVAHTGYWPSESMPMSATTDYADNSIYWSFFGFASERDRKWNENGVSAVIKVNPATAESEIINYYPRDERFTSVNVLNAHPKAPADIRDLTFAPDAFASTTALVKFTVPTVTAASEKMTGSLTVRVFVDGQQTKTGTVAPGSAYSQEVKNLTEGTHTVAVELQYGEFTGLRARATTKIGFDVPAAAKDVKLTSDDSRTVATLTWTAPTLSAGGELYPADMIRYKVVRYPGEVVVKRSLKETTITEDITGEFASTYYTVTPYHADYPSEFGKTTRSNSMMLGSAMSLPYSENFDTPSSMNGFTIVDVDGDGDPEVWASPCWKYDEQYYCAFYYGRRDVKANDWLITPPLKFDPDKLYRLSYKYYGYYGEGNVFRVAIGAEATHEGMDRELQRVERASTAYDMPGFDESVVFGVRPGDKFIGFHHISETREHLSIDNILIEEYGDARTPAKVSDLSGRRLSDTSLELTFAVPTLNGAGNELSGELTAKIYRGVSRKACAEFTGLKPGQTVVWTDNAAAAGVNSFRVVASNSFGDGMESTIDVDLTDPAPKAVSSVKARFINESQIEVTWDALTDPVGENGNPIDLSLVRYIVFKPVLTAEGTTDYEVVGRDIEGCRFVDPDPMAGLLPDTQLSIAYYVSAVNGAGQGYATLSNAVTVGPAYNLPFAETWKNQTVSTNPWFKGVNTSANWYVMHKGYDPVCDGQDGYGVMTCELTTGYASGTATLATPRVDLGTASNPTLRFWMYRSPVYSQSSYLRVGLDIEGEDNLVIFPTVYSAKAEQAGWEEISISLKDFASKGRVSVMLIGNVVTDGHIHIDNFSISGTAAAAGLRPEFMSGAADGRVGEPMKLTATATNLSTSTISGKEASVKLDGKVVAKALFASVEAGKRATAEFEFTPEKAGAGVLTLTIDGSAAAPTKEISVIEANEPRIHDLKAVASVDDEEMVYLTWGTPASTDKAETAIDNFEAYEGFSISGVGAWTLYDGDEQVPFKFSDGQSDYLRWPNFESPQSFIVFNNEEFKVPFGPRSGNQMLVCWGSPYGNNDDWLISPRLTGHKQLVSFYAASVSGNETEPFDILVSTTDTRLSSFTAINGLQHLTVSGDWDIHHFAVPEGTKYFAIRYLGESHYGMRIDDFRFCGYHHPVSTVGYNVYRDGKRLNSEPITTNSFTDLTAPASAVYTVRPLYAADTEGLESNEARIIPASISDVAAVTDITVKAGAGTIEVDAPEGLNAEVFTPSGVKVASVSAPCTIEVAPGLYLVRCGSATAKLLVK